MINTIHMEGVASFKQPTSLSTDKRINLIYGLNGVGKSTISNYLYPSNDSVSTFSKCYISPAQQLPILVYNQKFIQDNFYEQDSLKGIFSLSKENKEAEAKIEQATRAKEHLKVSLKNKNDEKDNLRNSFISQKQKAIETIWKIKTHYSGGDRVLEYCLEGLMGKKENLFNYIRKIIKPTTEPTKNIEEIKREVGTFKDDNSIEIPLISKLDFNKGNIENNVLFTTAIIGNSDSEVADMIEHLGNADWVKQGLGYLSQNLSLEAEKTECPFCQENTITSHFIHSIHRYFDETYQSNINTLEHFRFEYQSSIVQLPKLDAFTQNEFAKNYIEEISEKYSKFENILKENLQRIESKIKNPKANYELISSHEEIKLFNQTLDKINDKIHLYNSRLRNKKATLNNLKSEFWSVMRWQYDQTLSRFEQDEKYYKQKELELDKEITSISLNIEIEEQKIANAQRKTVNIDEAINAINAGLQDIGIDSFKIIKHSNNLYKIIRGNSSEDAFRSLSEGEKMMISFLYFCELCKGKSSEKDTSTNKIIVIDDPISSLSHIFVFNIGRLIKNLFFKDERFSQIFVLTHSLYFFYELTETNHKKREESQSLFRISKSSNGSCIQIMKYEEIQNDYQAYWNVINDKEQPPALIANCMRNIIEYFFNFVRKKDLGNVFQMPELQANHLQAFYRYINRESHSIGQNLIDMKEFKYDDFKEGLKLIFEKTGYLEHFNAMSKIK
ncbi:AAA family ATPase [Actinobacillus equuli]|uniref:AAA family ATPase n=1 Tax=Actinobacillus equuli TaxID=718 RepID=UPI00244260DB|nr:AAA family ATPase [Actinobacillus equuli]WGE41625.1 AAA family ATPase [Actinobacillus equuli subsp. haemolyticus]